MPLSDPVPWRPAGTGLFGLDSSLQCLPTLAQSIGCCGCFSNELRKEGPFPKPILITLGTGGVPFFCGTGDLHGGATAP